MSIKPRVISNNLRCLNIKSWLFGHHSAFSLYKAYATQADVYFCNVEAEPLHRYKPGGYHPVHLGDEMSDKRYRIVHKIGYGGYSTVWLAKDRLSVTFGHLHNDTYSF